MLTELQPQKKSHVLKHFQGGRCHVFDTQNPHRMGEGFIDEVDIEDDMVLIKQGEESHWVDANFVYPGDKEFKDLKDEHLDILLRCIKFNGEYLDKEGVRYRDRYFHKNFVFIPMGGHLYLYIHSNWNVVVKRVGEQIDIEFIDNMPEVIFTLCDMGFDVLDKN